METHSAPSPQFDQGTIWRLRWGAKGPVEYVKAPTPEAAVAFAARAHGLGPGEDPPSRVTAISETRARKIPVWEEDAPTMDVRRSLWMWFKAEAREVAMLAEDLC